MDSNEETVEMNPSQTNYYRPSVIQWHGRNSKSNNQSLAPNQSKVGKKQVKRAKKELESMAWKLDGCSITDSPITYPKPIAKSRKVKKIRHGLEALEEDLERCAIDQGKGSIVFNLKLNNGSEFEIVQKVIRE